MPAVGSYLVRPTFDSTPALSNQLNPQADHMAVPVSMQVPIQDSIHQLEVSPLSVILEVFKYLISGGGVLGRPFQNASSFFPTRLLDASHAISTASTENLDVRVPGNRPDIEFMHFTLNTAEVETPGVGAYSFLVTLIRPKSTGTVRLATANPRARPNVDLGYLSDPADYEPMRKGIRVALRVFEEVRKQGYPVVGLLEVPPDGGADDVALDAWIRARVRTVFHYTSTCRMGSSAHGERPSVVDQELRVHGVRGLRVCDTSVFPEIIGSHTMAPAVVVAEKCADLVKATWR